MPLLATAHEDPDIHPEAHKKENPLQSIFTTLNDMG